MFVVRPTCERQKEKNSIRALGIIERARQTEQKGLVAGAGSLWNKEKIFGWHTTFFLTKWVCLCSLDSDFCCYSKQCFLPKVWAISKAVQHLNDAGGIQMTWSGENGYRVAYCLQTILVCKYCVTNLWKLHVLTLKWTTAQIAWAKWMNKNALENISYLQFFSTRNSLMNGNRNR